MQIFPPFEPDDNDNKGRVRSLTGVPIRVIIPNFITLLALASGLTSIRLAVDGRFEFAVAAIMVAVILDALDGRVARLLRSATRFGAELDSLTDFLNFGVAPPVVLYAWLLRESGNWGWIVAIIFACCTALRLARFNVALDDETIPDWKRNFFVGVPAPGGALLALLPLYLHLANLYSFQANSLMLTIYLLMVGFLMVSRFPVYSGKKAKHRVPREYVIPAFFIGLLFFALAISNPWHILSLVAILYLLILPLSLYLFISTKKKMEKERIVEEQEQK